MAKGKLKAGMFKGGLIIILISAALFLGWSGLLSQGHQAHAAEHSASDLTAVTNDQVTINSTKALSQSELSVVRILVVYRGQNGQPLDQVGMGSGFVVAPGFILTNYHVVETPPGAQEAEIYIVPHKDVGAHYQKVSLVKSWTEGDMALLSATEFKSQALTLSMPPKKNQRVVAMGYPGVTDRILKRGGTELLEPGDAYVTQGSIALFASTNPDGSKVETLFHTAPINLGNSGGPLLNECGQVVGINTWSAASSLSDSGDVDVPAGQFVATHVSAIRAFLQTAGLKPVAATQSCFAKTDDEIIKDDALATALSATAIAQKQKADEAKKALDAQKLMNSVMLGFMVAMAVIILLLIALLMSRRPHREPLAPTAFSATPDPRAGASEPSLSLSLAHKGDVAHPPHRHWGWLMLGGGIIILAAALILTYGKVHRMPGFGASLNAINPATKGVVHLSCGIDNQASKNPLSAAGPIRFDFEPARACVNGRTPYEPIAGGPLTRYTLLDKQPARLELSPDGMTFKRFDYQLSPETLQSFVDQSHALATPHCADPSKPAEAAALAESLRKIRNLSQTYLSRNADQITVWTCHPTTKP